MPDFYAHTVPDTPKSAWELLPVHLDEVAEIAGHFASAFGAKDWGLLAGRWHDLGKYSQAFQDYIAGGDPDAGEESTPAKGRVDHSTFGAKHAVETMPGAFGQILAFCIAGHHAGLPDAAVGDDQASRASLQSRLAAGPPRVPHVDLPPGFPKPPPPPFPWKPDGRDDLGIRTALFVRMLFSCLVDADRTATERFCDRDRADRRAAPKPTIAAMAGRLDAYLETKRSPEPTPVNRIRAAVLADCRSAADHPPGFFALNVPTGGGKTLSSLAFAFKHAQKHGLNRVVVAIPFTSIIEQTADVYRSALGDLARLGLVEHHSNIDPPKHTRENQMAAENWDAPLIVTTNVQLYESLFAAGTTPCRKLHRLANSVIVLDEAQTIPLELLTATLAALRRLVSDYGCTIVLCTATQPALERNDDFKIGIEPGKIRDIVPPGRDLHTALRRVDLTRVGKLSDDDLAAGATARGCSNSAGYTCSIPINFRPAACCGTPPTFRANSRPHIPIRCRLPPFGPIFGTSIGCKTRPGIATR